MVLARFINVLILVCWKNFESLRFPRIAPKTLKRIFLRVTFTNPKKNETNFVENELFVSFVKTHPP